MTPDLRSARIYYSVLGDEKSKKSTKIGLKQAKGYIRKLIGERLRLRFTPEITFDMDDTSEYVQKIEDIIDKIHKENDKKNNDKP